MVVTPRKNSNLNKRNAECIMKLKSRSTVLHKRSIGFTNAIQARTVYKFLFATIFTLYLTSTALLVSSHPLSSSSESISGSKEYLVTPERLKDGYIIIDLPESFRIFGNARYKSLYINAVGAVSFGGAITTSDVNKVKNGVIAFAPMLLMPRKDDTQTLPGIQMHYKTSVPEKVRVKIEQEFRHFFSDSSFTVKTLFILSIEDHNTGLPEGNSYHIVFVTNGERTYVRYEYHKITRIRDDHGYARAGAFAFEDGFIICADELKGSGTAEVEKLAEVKVEGQVPVTYLRADLPLECRTLESDCGALRSTDEQFLNAKRVGSFFETITDTIWKFYSLYFCLSQYSRIDKSSMIRQGCLYEPDYYTYSWRELGEADQCRLAISTTT